jgi:hypothetical protein
MFEGTEKQGPIGAGGAYIVDVTDKGIAKAEAKWSEGGVSAGVFVEVDVITILEKLAAQSSNKIDDAMVSMIKGALGR